MFLYILYIQKQQITGLTVFFVREDEGAGA